MRPMILELKKRFGSNIFTTREDVTLEGKLVEMLKRYGLTVTTARAVPAACCPDGWSMCPGLPMCCISALSLMQILRSTVCSELKTVR